MSDSFGSNNSQPGANPSKKTAAVSAAAAARPLRSNSAPASKRSSGAMAFLAVGVLCLLGVLCFIAYDRVRTPSIKLPETMPVASEVQEWNSHSKAEAPAGGNLTAVDPVSKEPLDPNATPYKINIGSTWFYFTSEAHLKAFTDDPFKYVKVNINVKLLGDGAPPVGNDQNESAQSGDAASGAATSDSASLYQQIPAPQGEASSADISSSAGSNTADAVSANGAGHEAASENAAEGQPAAVNAADGQADASLYQQIPPPMAPQSPPSQQPLPPVQPGDPGIGEAIQQNTPVGMPLQDYSN